MNNCRIKNQGGFSLAEFLVALAMFLILTSSIFGTLVVGIRYYEKSTSGLEAKKSVRDVVSIVTSEMRHAVPNPAPGFSGNEPTGYRAVTPSIAPTGVLYPNAGSPETDFVLFTEPDFSHYDPDSPEWFTINPENFIQVKYFINNGNTLVREVTSFNTDGSFKNRTRDDVVIFEKGSLRLEASVSGSPGPYPLYNIAVTAIDDEKTFSLSSKIAIPSQEN